MPGFLHTWIRYQIEFEGHRKSQPCCARSTHTMEQASSSRPFARPRVSVAVDDTPPLAMPSPGRMIDTLTPKTRRVSKLPQAEVLPTAKE